MKHKFGKSKTHKDSGLKESAPNDHELEAAVEADKEGKKGFKLFRKRSKTFSGHKHATGEETDSTSQENSPAIVRRGHSVSPPPGPSPPSPVSSRRRAATLANRPLPSVEDTKIDDSHDYAECGEKIPPRPKPSQEHSGNTTSGSLKAVSNSSIAQPSPTDRISIASDFLPSLHPETVPTDPLILSVGQLQALMAEAISDSCKKISVMYKQLFTPPSSLKVTWNDCKSRQDWPAVDIDGKAYGVQVRSLFCYCCLYLSDLYIVLFIMLFVFTYIICKLFLFVVLLFASCFCCMVFTRIVNCLCRRIGCLLVFSTQYVRTCVYMYVCMYIHMYVCG